MESYIQYSIDVLEW